MTIRFDLLARSLKRARRIDDFVLYEREAEVECAAIGASDRTRQNHRAITVHAFRDIRGSRTGCSLTVDAGGRMNHDDVMKRLAVLLPATREPAWRMPDATAAARVQVDSPDLADLPAAARGTANAIAAAVTERGVVASGLVVASHTMHRLAVSNGLTTEYSARALQLDATLSSDRGTERLRTGARRTSDISIGRELAPVLRALVDNAEPVSAGDFDVVLRLPALVAGIDQSQQAGELPTPRGWWWPFIAQAGAERDRLGLSRYAIGQKVVERLAGTDALTIGSDGTRPFGWSTAAFGPRGGAVRRFDVVRDDVARGLSLDARSAGLLGTRPNGGVRNLVVAGGPADEADLLSRGERDLLVVHSMAALDVAASGEAIGVIGRATRVGKSGGKRALVRGGTVAANVFDLLGRARLSRQLGQRHFYSGPRTIRIDRVRIG